MTVPAVGATAPSAGVFATVQAAYDGSKVQTFANGIFSFLGKVLSTLFAHKWKTAAVVVLAAGAFVYNKYSKEINAWFKANIGDCSSSSKPPVNNNNKDNKDEKKF